MGVRKYRKIGNPHMALATTCHCERMNLNVRLFSRRFTRLTLGFSKRLENLKLSNALFIAFFQFLPCPPFFGDNASASGGAYRSHLDD